MADRKSIVPPIKTEGWFELTPPFKLEEGKIYVCEEIRSFEELGRLGKNVLQDVYITNGLTESIYEEDKAAEAPIITLKPFGGAPVYVPSTYILTYPGMKGSGYATKLIVLEVGLVPASFDMSEMKVDIADYVKSKMGVDAAVSEANHIYDKTLSPAEQVALEKARRLAIENYIPKDQQIKTLQETNVEITAQRDALLEEIIKLREELDNANQSG